MSLRIHSFIVILFFALNAFSQSQPPLQVIAEATSIPAPGDSLDVEIRMSDFDALTGFTLFYLWDSTVMRVDTVPFVNTTDLPGFNRAGISLPQDSNRNPQQGQVQTLWFSGNPQTIPDSTHLLTLRFIVVGNPCDTTSISIGDVSTASTDMSNVIDSNFEEIDFEITSDLIQIQGPNCGGGGGNQGPVGFDLLNVTSANGTNVCMPLVVTNFDSIDSFSGSIGWNMSQLTFTNVRAFGVSGFASSNFNILNSGNGEIDYSWTDATNNMPASLPNGGTLFEVCFDVIGTPGASALVDILDIPTAVTATMAPSSPGNPSIPLSTNTNSGIVTIEQIVTAPPVTFSLPSIQADPGDNVCLPITVQEFNNISSFMASVSFNENILQYTGAQSFGITTFSQNNINANDADNGNVGFTWLDISTVNAATIPDGDVLVELCFDVIGNPGQSSLVEFSNTPFNINITTPNSVLGAPAIPLLTNLIDGSVTVAGGPPPPPPATGITLTVTNASGENGDNVCVPITVEDFVDITAVTGSIMWDETILSYSGIGNTPLPGFSPGNNLNESQTANGMLGILWSDATGGAMPLTLDDGDNVIEICFDVIGDAGESTDVKITDMPATISASQQPPNPQAPSVSIDVEVVDGVFNVGGTPPPPPPPPPSTGITLTVTNASGQNGDNVCVPITVLGFVDITAVTGSIMWDETILSYTGIGNTPLPGFSPGNNLNESQTANGMLGILWSDATGGAMPLTLDDGDNVIEICFDVIGAAGESSDVKITDMPATISASQQPPNPQAPSVSIDVEVVDGVFNVGGVPPPPPPPTTEVQFVLGDEEGDCGDIVCVPLTVSNFVAISSVTGSINWNPGQLSYSGIQNVVLPEFNAGSNLNETQTSTGQVGFIWSDPTAGNAPFTAQDGSAILEICFEIVGPTTNSTADVQMGNNPSTISVSQQLGPPSEPSTNLDFNLIPGEVEILEGCSVTPPSGAVSFVFPEICVSPSVGDICIPLVVTNFDSIVQLDFSLMWDPSVLSFEDFDNVDLTGFFADSQTNTSQINEGRLSFVWFDQTGNNMPETIADGDVLLEVCFEVVGDLFDVSEMTLFDGDSQGLTDIAVGRAGADPSIPTMMVPHATTPGSVTLKEDNILPFQFIVEQNTVDTVPLETCVDVSVRNYDNIVATEWNLAHDPALLCFSEIRNINPNVPTLNAGFFDTTIPGIVKLAWSDPSLQGRTIPDGDVYFSVCYDVKLNCQESASITILEDASQAAFLVVTNADDPDEPIEASGAAGSVFADCEISSNPLTFGASSVNNIRCNGECSGSITQEFTGGMGIISCSWTGPNGFSQSSNCSNVSGISGLCAGNYTLVITDQTGSGNAITQSYTISEPAPISINPVVFNANCDAAGNPILGRIETNPSGGTGSLTQSPTSSNLVGIVAGTYRIQVTDSNNCQEVEFVTVGDDCDFMPGPPFFTRLETTPGDICGMRGSIIAVADGGVGQVTISFDPAITSTNAVIPGTYTVTAMDQTGQTAVQVVVVGEDFVPEPLPSVVVTGPGNSCTGVGGSADITITGGCEPVTCLLFFEDTAPINCSRSDNLLPGNYRVEVTDNIGRTNSQEFVIPNESPDDFGAFADPSNTAPCSFSDGMVEVRVNGGCEPYNINISTTDGSGTPPLDTLVNMPGSYIFGLPTGTYEVVVTDNSGADPIVIPFMIDEGVAPIIQSGPINISNDCISSFPVSGGSQPYLYQWFDENMVLLSDEFVLDLSDRVINLDDTLSITQDVIIVVTDAEGCTFDFDQTITCLGLVDTDDPVDPDPDLTFNGVIASQQTLCAGDQLCQGVVVGDIAQEGDLGPYLITLINTTNQEVTTITQEEEGAFSIGGLCAGSYSLLVTDGNGMDWNFANNLQINAPPAIEVELVNSDCDEDTGLGTIEIAVEGGTGAFGYDWVIRDTTIDAEEFLDELENGSYLVTITDSNGCQESRIFTVDCMIDTIVPMTCEATPIITPGNGDTANENLFITCVNGNQPIQIFDRWGNLVWQTNRYNNNWNGINLDSEEVLEGAYYWVLMVEDDEGNTTISKGTVTVLRDQ